MTFCASCLPSQRSSSSQQAVPPMLMLYWTISTPTASSSHIASTANTAPSRKASTPRTYAQSTADYKTPSSLTTPDFPSWCSHKTASRSYHTTTSTRTDNSFPCCNFSKKCWSAKTYGRNLKLTSSGRSTWAMMASPRRSSWRIIGRRTDEPFFDIFIFLLWRVYYSLNERTKRSRTATSATDWQLLS